MRLLVSSAGAMLALIAVPAFAQDLRAPGNCAPSEKLEDVLRTVQKVQRIDQIDCDAIAIVDGKSATFSKDGKTLVTFTGHDADENGMQRIIVDTITLPGRAPMQVVRGICTGGPLPGGGVATVCVASYQDGDTLVGAQTIFSGAPAN